MAHAISVRLDDETVRALRKLEATGLSRSESIRRAILTSAERLSNRDSLRSEVAALERNEKDLAEMRRVALLMDVLRATG
jgi:predicted transcriptional regulator